MLEIVRGRNWSVAHTVLEGADGPPTDLSVFTLKCQIREKLATRNSKGFFEHKLIASPTVIVEGSVFYLKLSSAASLLLQTGEYIIDVVSTGSESFLDTEPIKVVNRPTLI